jgi:tripartite-type tricarboxylate transporter receptor subunit TctC
LRAGLSGDHVAYRSGALAINDLLSGTLPSMFGSPVDVLAHIESGKLRAIATTGLKRHESLPNVPTVAESGYPGFEALNWSAFIAPKQTPIGVIRQLNLAIVAELSDPATVEQLKKMGLDVAPSTPEEAGAFIRREAAKWGDIVKQTGIKAD